MLVIPRSFRVHSSCRTRSRHFTTGRGGASFHVLRLASTAARQGRWPEGPRMLPWREAGRHVEGEIPIARAGSRHARAGARERGTLGDTALPRAPAHTPRPIAIRSMNPSGLLAPPPAHGT